LAFGLVAGVWSASTRIDAAAVVGDTDFDRDIDNTDLDDAFGNDTGPL